jgi:hypothetical protein
MEWIIAMVGVLFVTQAWLSVIASAALVRTDDLERIQKIAQLIFVWLVPYFGAVLVLRLLAEHDQKAIPSKWVPNQRINASIRQLLGIESRLVNRFSRNSIENEVAESVSEGLSGGGGD